MWSLEFWFHSSDLDFYPFVSEPFSCVIFIFMSTFCISCIITPCDLLWFNITHPDGSRSTPSRWHQISAWRSTRGWPLGLGSGSGCGPPGLGPGTDACSPGSRSTWGRGSPSPCGTLSRCSIPALQSLANRRAALQTQTIAQSVRQPMFTESHYVKSNEEIHLKPQTSQI